MKNTLAKLSLYAFYFCALSILIIQSGKYLVNLSFIEDFILFIPRWLVFSPLILTVIINHRLIKPQLIFISVTSILLIFFYLNFSISLPQISTNKSGHSIRVMSFNMSGGSFDSRKLNIQIEFNQPDIMVFQESSHSKLKKTLPKNWFLNCQQSQCVASKTKSKITDFQTRRIFDGWGTFAALFELTIAGQTVYILNVHLETPRKAYENIRYGQFNLSLMKKIYEQRYLEATLAKSLAVSYSPLIIAGDFNMTSDSWIYNYSFGEYSNAFNDKGLGFGDTKHTTLLGVKIDHILIDQDFSVVNSWVDIDTGSDHRPLFADILFNPTYQISTGQEN
jgi:endonuclease/exonuclease/phosphatase family metal-dependent hydrolase